MHEKLEHRDNFVSRHNGDSHAGFQTGRPRRGGSWKVRIIGDVLNPGRSFRLPHTSWKPNPVFKVRCFRRGPEQFQVTVAAIPSRTKFEKRFILIWHSRMSHNPTRFLADLAKND